MTRFARFLSAFPVALIVLICMLVVPLFSAPAQTTYDTLRVAYLRLSNSPAAFISGAAIARAAYTRIGPDSAPASTATADSIVIHPTALTGYGMEFELMGTSATSHAKSVVVTVTAAGATTTVDSLQMKTGGGNWATSCKLIVRNAVPTTDSTQIFFCSHTGSADSSTTSTAAPLTMTLKMVPGGVANYIAVHNSTGTAKGDVVVQAIKVKDFAGGRVNP